MLVVKIGGGESINLEACCADAAELVKARQRLVLVHGGSHQTNVLSQALGHPARFATSVSGYQSRYTDRRTLEIFCMAYAGQVNKRVVELLQARGVNALGLSGADGRLWEGERKAAIRIIEDGKKKILRDDYTGRVERVNSALLELLLGAGYLPVLCPPAISYQGELINVDGDRAAAATAAALKAEALILLTGAPGLLREFPDESTLIPHIPARQVEEFMPFAQGRMKKKVMGASEALAGGVRQVIFADGRIERPISRALEGAGTIIS
ncbi:MAG: [LysW]-aminoadipate kinase [Deinococcus sp.]|nr:[LysW]-aminoadipate kinase [Deinococcus sp.]